ncbi:uncharacterized protein LOC130676032 [Microplitis mediator]|uniref:uncharacterized protein LOC130676032 n=1 Tax=Microplitis mediator TaxID=375433 RepID=UPI002555A542|nr:uncharacterized protein LOC130676032 [Microplitis mediator]
MPNTIYPDWDHWTPIESLDGHIFSAYLDTRPEVIIENYDSYANIVWAVVRIIAILPSDTKTEEVECIFKFESEDRKNFYRKKAASKIKFLDAGWKLKYSSAVVTCDLTHTNYNNYDIFYQEKKLPQSVGIVHKNSDNTSLQLIDINYPKHGVNQPDTFSNKFMALCVSVLHHKFDRPLELIEFIEYYRLMGVSQFIFYNSSISESVSRVLKHYRAIDYDLIKILQWNLSSSYIYEQTLRLEGLYAGLNDCLYRNSLHDYFKYLGVFNVDEFLVTKIHKNFSNLMDYLDPLEYEEKNGNAVSFLFQHIFFYTMYPDDENNLDDKEPYLYTKEKIQRLRDPHAAGVKSRYIIRTRDVVEIGNYQSTKLLKDKFYEVVVRPDIALLHHYAPCEAEETGCYLKPVVIDRTAVRFTDKLGKNVAIACRKIFDNKRCPHPRKRIPGEINS